MKKLAKMLVCLILSCILALPQAGMIPVWADDSGDMVTDVVKNSVTDTNAKNYFAYTAYSGKNWTILAGESYIDLDTTDARAEECYYEIHFEGNAISVTATKQPNHGKVKFILDGETEQVVDLYSASKTNEVVYSADGLTEGGHVLRAVTQTDKTGGKIVNQVICAEITHEPYKGGTPSLGGTIEDTNWQYTQDRYGEISSKTANDTAELTAWKNDKATSEIVLYSKSCSLENLEVMVAPLKCGKEIIGTEHIKTTFLKSTKAYNGGYLGYATDHPAYPEVTAANRSESSDILYQEGGSVDMAWNSLQPVWVEFNIPADAKAGDYTTTLTATADGIEEPLQFTYTVRVQNVILPDADTYADTFDIELWQHPYSSAEYYDVEPFSEEHLNILEPIMLKYKEIGGHAITASIVEEAWSGQTYSKNEIHYPSMVKWTKNEDGSFSYDYEVFDTWVSFCKDLGIGDKIVLYSIAPWHNSFKYWEGGVLKTEAFGSDETYTAKWQDFLEDLVAHLDEMQWFDDAYIGIDEKGFSQRAFDVIASVENKDGHTLKTAGAMDHFVNKANFARLVDDLNVGDNAAAGNKEAFEQLLADREAKGLRTTLYSCTEHKPGNFSLSIPAESYWSLINAGRMGTAGFLRWAYDAWVEDPLRDTTHAGFEPGDCFLVFPDEKDALEPECKSSVRLERMAEGIRDVNKLMYLEREMPELSEEIEELYAGLEMTATTGRTYLSEAQKEQVAAEATAFKKGVAAITAQYLYQSASENGLYLAETEKDLALDTSWKISPKLVQSQEDKTIIYASEDPSIVSVDASGTVTARKIGSTVIRLKSKAAGYTAAIRITVSRNELRISNALTDYRLPEEYLSDVEIDRENEKGRRYLGQPDMIMLNDEDKTLITLFPVGHGVGEIVMKISRDHGETWEEKTDIPESWERSYETPTIYRLDMTDGTTKLIVISGRPRSFGAVEGGIDSSISTDNGEHWTDYKRDITTLADGSRNETVVAMASLIQLKDENGEYIDKWMGVYHDGYSFVNYKTYLTFDENGVQQWSTPEPYLSEWRSVESSHQICEVGLSRSPDGKRIFGLARNQTHNGPATMFYSDDEGETWSCPVALPGSLAGERHKIMYDPTDPTGQRMIIPFREIQYDKNGNNRFDGGSDWMAGDWVAWVGTYDDIMNQRDGSYRILLCEDFTQNTYSGDTGYSGLVVLPDGTFIMDTYGHWDEAASLAHKQAWVDAGSSGQYNCRGDLCWIKQAKFRLSDLEAAYPELKEGYEAKLSKEIEKAPQEEELYTVESWEKYQDALMDAENILDSPDSTHDEIMSAFCALQQARLNLVMEGADKVLSPDDPENPDNPENPDDPNKEQQILEAAKKDLESVVSAADAVINAGKKDYSEESWNAFLKAYKEAEEGKNSSDPAKLKSLMEALDAAQKALTSGQGGSGDLKEFELDGCKYEVIDAAALTVKLVQGKDAGNVTVDTIEQNGKTYTVTVICSKAFNSCKTLKTVTIGANIVQIEKNAFYNCKKLKTIKFKAKKKLPSMAKKAFNKTKAKPTVKVQKALRKNAKIKQKTFKALKKAGLKITVKNIK